MMNSTENINNKKSTYHAESQKRYGEKCIKFTVKYTPNESEISEVVSRVISESGLTPNKWIKTAILEKLEREGYLYDE